jgi:hypothetical protein
MFNLIYVPEGDKADFWILTDEPYLERWAKALSIAELWQRLKQEAEVI